MLRIYGGQSGGGSSTLPGIPQEVGTTSASLSLGVTWSLPTTGVVPTGYLMRAAVTGTDDWTTPQAVSGGATFAGTLNSLAAGTLYEVQVAATSSGEAGTWSASSECSTEQAIPQTDPFRAVSSSFFSSAESTVSVVVPAEVQVGDLMVLALAAGISPSITGGANGDWSENLYLYGNGNYGYVCSRGVEQEDLGATLDVSFNNYGNGNQPTAGCVALICYYGDPDPATGVSGQTGEGEGNGTSLVGPVLNLGSAANVVSFILFNPTGNSQPSAVDVTVTTSNANVRFDSFDNNLDDFCISLIVADVEQTSGDSTPITATWPNNTASDTWSIGSLALVQ